MDERGIDSTGCFEKSKLIAKIAEAKVEEIETDDGDANREPIGEEEEAAATVLKEVFEEVWTELGEASDIVQQLKLADEIVARLSEECDEQVCISRVRVDLIKMFR